MEEVPLLHDIVVIFGLSILVLLICHRMRIPAIVGYLLTGVLCGPHGLGLIHDEADVETLATIGIVLLLFIVGMEFSLKKIFEYKRYFLIGGFAQVILTVLAGFAIGWMVGSPPGESLFLGFLLSLSSTAIVLRLLQDARESDSPHGRVIMGMMIFQDIAAIPMMLSIPLLAGINSEMDRDAIYNILKGLAVLAIVIFSATKLVPKILYSIVQTRSRELFLLSVITICSSVAWLTSSIGLSLSLGAFLAGLIISDSEYRTEAIGDILPFQDIFTSFFFVSIGMLLNVGFFVQQPFYILFITFSVLCLKALLAGFSTFLLGMPLRTMVLVGLSMSQIGEFSFVLSKSGAALNLGSDYHYQLFLAVALVSMALTPLLLHGAPKMAAWLQLLPFIPDKMKAGLKHEVKKQPMKGHVIIIGYGVSGRNLSRSLREANIPYLILEMNAETVRKEKLKGETIYFGDASHEIVLQHANIDEAKTVAVLINDPRAAGRIVEVARKLNSNLFVIVRTRYLTEMKGMYHLGANEVIPDEFGSSVEVLTRVLHRYQVPSEDVQKIISGIRIEGYEILRLLYKEPTALSDLQITLSDILIETFRVQEGAPLAGKTLQEIDLRKNYDVTAMMIRRGDKTITSLNAQTCCQTSDVLVLTGTHQNLARAAQLFKLN
jgi:CPA2 family monovalent cation:H+ antiporter-2